MLSVLFRVVVYFYFLYFIGSSNQIGTLLWKCISMVVLVYMSHRDCALLFFTIADLFVRPFARNLPRNTLSLKTEPANVAV